jgi:hypothetical protein
MGVQWKQSDQTLNVAQSGELVIRLFGAAWFLFSFYFLYYLLVFVYEYATAFLRGAPGVLQDFVSSIPGVIFMLLMVAIFVVPGWILMMGSSRVRLDRGQNTITDEKNFLILKRATNYSTNEFHTVDVGIKMPTSDKSSRRLHIDVALKGKGSKRVLIAVFDQDEPQRALDLANQVAKLLDYTVREDLGGYSPSAKRTRPPKRESLVEKIGGLILVDLIGLPDWRLRRASKFPEVILGSVVWKFTGSAFTSRRSFDTAVRKYQAEDGESEDNWEPNAIALRAPRVAVQYECREDGEWVKPIVELSAKDGQAFTNSELFFELHNAIVEKLREVDNQNFQGLDLVDAEWKKSVPLYAVNQVE